LDSLSGYVGSYESTIKTKKGVEKFNHGVILVAIGAQEYTPGSFNYGKDQRVLTQSELEKKAF